ncbi:hypothetical protein DFQ27_001734 [Actinomortierella ambigua]|uniref:Uncharacterized protein n=1 Tax=Actinomortierella ambigua TaxID=1343610 RepID=A0A9P6QAG3_9FUNG|nr:hypothetical protein DFQ27_001734 [Actinomortierella ambigua]
MHAHVRRLLAHGLARRAGTIRPCLRSTQAVRTLATAHPPQPSTHSDLDEPLTDTPTSAAAAARAAGSTTTTTSSSTTTTTPEMIALSEESFQAQKRRLLGSLDVLVQIQNGPMEKNERSDLDDIEVEYWTNRVQSAIRDLQQESTRLRVAVIGDSSGQDSLMDLLMPSEENVRRSAKETGRVHRLRYGPEYSASEETGAEILERAPISWLEGLGDEDGGEIIEVSGYDLDDLTMDDIVYNSDLILLRTDALRQLSLEEEQRFLHRYRNKSNIVIVVDMNTTVTSSSSTDQQQQQRQHAMTMAALKANLHRAVKSTSHGYSNMQQQDRHIAGKILRVSNPEPLPILLELPPRTVATESQHLETVGALQHLVASTLMDTPTTTATATTTTTIHHRRVALLTRARDLVTAGIEAVEQRLVDRLKTYARVDQLSEQVTSEIKRVSELERRRIEDQVSRGNGSGSGGGEMEQDVATMHRVLDHFFRHEVPTWMLVARSGEIAERLEELWAAGCFAETEHRMAYRLGRLHQTALDVFWSTGQALRQLHDQLQVEGLPIGAKAVRQDLEMACAGLDRAREQVQRGVKDKDAFVLSNVVWKARSTFGGPLNSLRQQQEQKQQQQQQQQQHAEAKKAQDTQASIPPTPPPSSHSSSPSSSSSATSTPTSTYSASALDRLQRRGQVALAQGLGIETSAVATGVGLATQFPPEVYLTSSAGIALVGLGYMHLRWKAAQAEFRAEADQVAQQLKQELLETYEDQVQRTMVEPLTNVVGLLDKNLGERLLRSLDQRDVLKTIKQEAQGVEQIKY